MSRRRYVATETSFWPGCRVGDRSRRGRGQQLHYYPPGVAKVVAVEPEPYLRERARRPLRTRTSRSKCSTASRTGFRPRIHRSLPPLCVWCCAPSLTRHGRWRTPACAAPSGELRFYEHVLSDRHAIALSQRAVDRVFWPRAFGGCHTARDTPAAIAAAGFEIEHQRQMWVNPVPIAFPVASHAIGRARRR